jgi:hypothetical protein
MNNFTGSLFYYKILDKLVAQLIMVLILISLCSIVGRKYLPAVPAQNNK